MTGVATGFDAAPQHGPRPLPLFLDMLRSETAESPERRAAAIAGLRAYQDAPREERGQAMPQVARAGRAVLRSYGGCGRPVVFVPSLINPPHILDLAPANSLLRWIAGEGFAAFLIDWGEPASSDAWLDVAGHVEQRLLPLIAGLGEPPVLVGYCLGGTMAIAAACCAKVAGVAAIAAPWRFDGYGDGARRDMTALWDAAAEGCGRLGAVPMEVLQAGFWQLDPARVVAKYEAFARTDPASEAARSFVALEDWANAGAPLTFAAGRDLFEAFVGNDLPGRGCWAVGGRTIDPAALACPAVEFVSLTDRIVPASSSAGLPDRRELGAGHVGMVIGRGARSQLWEPLAEWLRSLGSAA